MAKNQPVDLKKDQLKPQEESHAYRSFRTSQLFALQLTTINFPVFQLKPFKIQKTSFGFSLTVAAVSFEKELVLM